ncbi:cell division control protein 6 homolog B-like protein [Tanacetum coccineum]
MPSIAASPIPSSPSPKRRLRFIPHYQMNQVMEGVVTKVIKSPKKKLLDSFLDKPIWNPTDSDQLSAVKEVLHVSKAQSVIVCREDEQKRIVEFSKQCLEQYKAGSLYICGCPGTGKSLSMENVKGSLAAWAKETGGELPDILSINCTSLSTTSEIFNKILGKSQPNKKSSGRSAPLRQLQQLYSQKQQSADTKMMFVIADELDYLITKDRVVLHDLFMLTTLPFSKIILIGIANAIDLADRFLPKLQSLNCKPMVVSFRAYSMDQIIMILKQRLMALPYTVFQPQALELCARKVSAASGDMRKALGICRGAIEMLETELRENACTSNLSSMVRVDHMAIALSRAYKSPIVDTIQSLPQHQQIVLCSAVKLFRRGKKDTTIGELNKYYIDLCKSTLIPPVGIMELSCMCRVLGDQGILKLGQSRDDKLRRVTLQVDEADINFALQYAVNVKFNNHLIALSQGIHYCHPMLDHKGFRLSVNGGWNTTAVQLPMIEPLASYGNLRSCHFGRGGLGGSSETRSDSRHKVDITCFQETKWKSYSTKEGNGYKLCDRIITLTLAINGETVNVISAYAPQVGLSEGDKKTFWDSLDEVVRVPDGPKIVFRGRLEWSYRGGDRGTPRRKACSSQHKLLALGTLFKRVQRRRVGNAPPRILWKNLNGDALEAFISKVAEGVSTQAEAISASDADTMWNIMACIIKTHTTRRESWWLCEDVQSKVTVKQARFREFLLCREGNKEERLKAQEKYKEAKKEAKKAVAQAKEKAYEDLYKRLDFKEGANDIFRIAKAQEKRRDLGTYRTGGTRRSCGPFHTTAIRMLLLEDQPGERDEGIFWLTSLFNKIFTSAKMPEEWRLSDVILIFQNKCDVQVCNKYRGIKLLGHTMKLWERVIERRLRRETMVSENQVEVAELRMLRWTCRRAELEVETIINKMREGWLRWFGHVKRRPQSTPVRRVGALVVDDLRRRGRPKLRWEDRVKHDMKEVLLSEDMTSNRNKWRARIRLGG